MQSIKKRFPITIWKSYWRISSYQSIHVQSMWIVLKAFGISNNMKDYNTMKFNQFVISDQSSSFNDIFTNYLQL